MTRTLHILEPACTAWPVMLHLAGTRSPGDWVLLLGTTNDELLARRLGLVCDARVAPALRVGALAWPGVRRLALRLAPAGFDRVHVYSAGACAAARLVLPSVPTCVTLSTPPARDMLWMKRLERACIESCESVVFSSVSVRDAWSSRLGLVAARAVVMSPTRGVEGLRVPAPVLRSETVRERWNVEPGERVLLALADAPRFIDARRFIFHCGVMSIAGHRLVGVVPPDAAQLERAVRFTRRHHGAWRLVIDDTPTPELLPVADAALAASVHCEWAVALARRFGVPVVGAGEANADRLHANSALLRVLESANVTHAA